MAAVDLQTVTSNLLKLDSSPLNHASAVIEELKSDTDRSEEVSVDVHITKEVEDAGEDEHVILQEEVIEEEEAGEEDVVILPEEVTSNGTATPSEEASSEVTDSDAELEKEVVAEADVKKSEPVVVRRRSERIKKKHEACSGALFSDDDELPSPQVEIDGSSATSSPDLLAPERKSMLLKIFLLLIVFTVVSNLVAYLYLTFPAFSDSLSRGVSSLLELFKSAESRKTDL